MIGFIFIASLPGVCCVMLLPWTIETCERNDENHKVIVITKNTGLVELLRGLFIVERLLTVDVLDANSVETVRFMVSVQNTK